MSTELIVLLLCVCQFGAALVALYHATQASRLADKNAKMWREHADRLNGRGPKK